MKQVFTMYLYHRQWSPGDPPAYSLFASPDMTDQHYTLMRPVKVEVEVPDDFDPRPVKVAAIDEAIRDLRAEHQKALTDLILQRSELLAISVSVEDSIPGHSVPF